MYFVSILVILRYLESQYQTDEGLFEWDRTN